MLHFTLCMLNHKVISRYGLDVPEMEKGKVKLGVPDLKMLPVPFQKTLGSRNANRKFFTIPSVSRAPVFEKDFRDREKSAWSDISSPAEDGIPLKKNQILSHQHNREISPAKRKPSRCRKRLCFPKSATISSQIGNTLLGNGNLLFHLSIWLSLFSSSLRLHFNLWISANGSISRSNPGLLPSGWLGLVSF